MRAITIPLLLLIPLLVLGCFEPEATPYGPQSSTAQLPDDAEVDTFMASGLIPTYWQGDLEPYQSLILSCGYDSTSGFQAEPVFQFEMTDALQSAQDFTITGTYLKFTFAVQNQDTLQLDDNPDLGDDVTVRLWHLPELPQTGQSFANLIEQPGAWQVPFGAEVAGDPELDILPVKLDLPVGEGRFVIPADSVIAWLAAGEPVTLALEYVGPDSGGGVAGMINLHSHRSGSETGPSLIIKYIDDLDDEQSVRTESSEDGMVVLRHEPIPEIDPASTLIMLTGIPNAAQIDFSGLHFLWDLLEGSELMIIKATLTLYPDSSALFGLGPTDRHDNISSSGFPSGEGGLTVRVGSTASVSVEDPELETDNLLVSSLNIMTTVDAGDDDTGTVLQAPALKDPLIIPLIEWVQDYNSGSINDRNLLLSLNGRDDRLRQMGYHLTGEGTEPQLEITYIRRPSFE